MAIEVHATRMELLNLRRKLALAERGHKLLKDKEEALRRDLFILIREVQKLRKKVEEFLAQAVRYSMLARTRMEDEEIDAALLFTGQRTDITLGWERVLNVRVPHFEVKREGDPFAYGFAYTVPMLDLFLKALSEVMVEMVKLAELEKRLELVAMELQKTRRRVNVLEYRLIPELVASLKYIKMKLDEMERSNLSRIMRIKEIIRAH
ncbi:V-type ATP synthase subunit D [candidate division WOR-3 bacterium]|nr:V-type ATP synthase subunit D [candidate division WOR-3 bacterium]